MNWIGFLAYIFKDYFLMKFGKGAVITVNIPFAAFYDVLICKSASPSSESLSTASTYKGTCSMSTTSP